MWRFQWIPREVLGHHSISNRNEDGVRVYITPFSSQFLLTEAKHGVWTQEWNQRYRKQRWGFLRRNKEITRREHIKIHHHKSRIWCGATTWKSWEEDKKNQLVDQDRWITGVKKALIVRGTDLQEVEERDMHGNMDK